MASHITVRGVMASEGRSEAKQVRRDPDSRRAEIVEAARDIFLERGFAEIGLAEVATAGSVSRPLVYRYFPGGRPDLFVAVAEDLVSDLHERLRHAASAPFSSAKRMEHLLAALFAFFTDNPGAYRVLFHEPWAARDDAVAAAVTAARAPLAAEIAELAATAGGTAEEVLLISTGILGCALANIELALSGAADAETAWRITCTFARTYLP
jgi:AcrR family transcriptional regulator